MTVKKNNLKNVLMLFGFVLLNFTFLVDVYAQEKMQNSKETILKYEEGVYVQDLEDKPAKKNIEYFEGLDGDDELMQEYENMEKNKI